MTELLPTVAAGSREPTKVSAAGFLLLLLLRMCSASRVCCCSCSSSSSCSSPSSTSQEAGCDCKEPAASELLVLLLLQRCCCCCCCTSQQLRATAVEWQQIFAASARESIDRGLQAPQYPDTRFPAPVYQTYSSSDSSTSPTAHPNPWLSLFSLSSPAPPLFPGEITSRPPPNCLQKPKWRPFHGRPRSDSS